MRSGDRRVSGGTTGRRTPSAREVPGEVEGLSTRLAAAEDKIAQIEAQQEKKQSPVFLDLPNISQLTARTSEATK